MSLKPAEKKPEQKLIVEIPVAGALGLLALGAEGIKAWKDKKRAEKANNAGDKK